MAEGSRSAPAAILGVLADLSPSAQQRSSALTIPLDWFRWLPVGGVSLFRPELMYDRDTTAGFPVAIDRAEGERLAAIDRIRPSEKQSLRVGWLFVAGRRPLEGGRMQRVFHPLLSVPVRIVVPPLLGDVRVEPAGDVSVTELVTDPGRRHQLEATYELGGGALDGMFKTEIPSDLLARLERLRQFATSAAEAAGFETSGLRRASSGADELVRTDGLVIVAGVGLYTATEVGGLSAASSLRSWAARSLPEVNAFSAVYLGGDAGAPVLDEDEDAGRRILTPFPLTPTQRRALSLSRSEAVSVVSGAAGTGKSHTVSAIACDAMSQGETVLVAAKTEAAVDALLALLGRAPGPEPVVFGSSERRNELARRLAAGELHPAERDELATAGRAAMEAVAERDELEAWIADRLRAEAFAARQDGRTTDRARVLAPGFFDPSCDLASVRRLLATATATSGWWARRRARKARARAAAVGGAQPETPLPALQGAADIAAQARAAGDLVAGGGLDLAADWSRLEALEAEVHQRVGRWLALTSRTPERLTRDSLAAVSVLATALRSGRAVRRDQLSRLDDRLTRALPLWVGTLGDIEDLLPATPSLFDLVILDEASAIDQPLAAPALLRAKRIVVVGDPHQLRHVSFLADEELRKAAANHGLDDDPVLVGRLDVRRNSLFDVAVGAAPTTVLDEHFRSDPHLVDFVAERLYGGRLLVATRSPATECSDCIEVVRATHRRDGDGVVRAEVRQVVRLLREMVGGGVGSVGVISPFRAQADALEEAVLDALTMADIEALDLRVGTVHAFQGNERDVVLVSLGIGMTDGPSTWRFAEDPHLFAVLATRARRRLVLLLSADPPAKGLLADYLSRVDAPPGRPRPAGVPDDWVASVAEWLSGAGVPTVPLYPTGRHAVDVCAGDRMRFLGIECRVHPSGPEAHVERHLALRRGGWELVDAYRSRWGDRQGELVVQLTERLRGHR